MERVCKNCRFWGDDIDWEGHRRGSRDRIENKSCENEKVDQQITVGYADSFDFNENFGCIHWEERVDG